MGQHHASSSSSDVATMQQQQQRNDASTTSLNSSSHQNLVAADSSSSSPQPTAPLTPRGSRKHRTTSYLNVSTDSLSSQTSGTSQQQQTVKILLLGLNGAGKSTIIKKLKEYITERNSLLQAAATDEIDHLALNKTFRDIIHFHALNGIKQLILASEKLDISILPRHSEQKSEIEFAINFLSNLHFRYGEHVLTSQVANLMKLLWEQRGSNEIHSEFIEYRNQQQQASQQQQQQQQQQTKQNESVVLSNNETNTNETTLSGEQSTATTVTSSAISTTNANTNSELPPPRVDTEEEDVRALSINDKHFNAGEINCFTLYKDLYNLDFFMSNIDRISEFDYVPTDEDVKYCQTHLKEEKKGIEEIEFDFSGARYTIYCVEGQNNDGRKWLFLFQGVDIVLFLCPIGDFDVVPTSLDRKNIVRESLEFFSKMCNSKWFRNTPAILLLSKWDTFREKITNTPLTFCFEDYDGDHHSYQHALKFLISKFNHVRDKEGKGLINTNIYQQFSTMDMNHEELANNLGGTIKNIRIEQKERERKLKMNGDASSPNLGGGNNSPQLSTTAAVSGGGNGSNHDAVTSSPKSPAMNGGGSSSSVSTNSNDTNIKHKLFSGLLQKLKKK